MQLTKQWFLILSELLIEAAQVKWRGGGRRRTMMRFGSLHALFKRHPELGEGRCHSMSRNKFLPSSLWIQENSYSLYMIQITSLCNVCFCSVGLCNIIQLAFVRTWGIFTLTNVVYDAVRTHTGEGIRIILLRTADYISRWVRWQAFVSIFAIFWYSTSWKYALYDHFKQTCSK